jgi:hypothetical protein
MASGGSDNRLHISVDLDSNVGSEFLNKLAHDDGFRDRLKEDPRGVLAEHGISVEGLPGEDVHLPPKDMVKDLHAQVTALAAPGGGTRPWFAVSGMALMAASLTTESGGQTEGSP